MVLTIGVLALQGAFLEHINLLRKAAFHINQQPDASLSSFEFIEVRTREQLGQCDALIIPGGESTTISLIAERSNLLEPLRDFVKAERKPTWGTCAGLILLAEAANATKRGGQELIGGLDVRVNRNHFGRQIESFVADVSLPFLGNSGPLHTAQQPFSGVFIRAPIVERILPHVEGIQVAEQEHQESIVAPSKVVKNDKAQSVLDQPVEVLAVLPGRMRKAAEAGVPIDSGNETGDIIAVRQGNVFGTSFHPELTGDIRIHTWWLLQVVQSASQK